jgi:ribosomal protein S18 acetylase RimI-like enzyme
MSNAEHTGTASSGAEEGRLIVRPARAEDREAVLAFCAGIWDGDDYIPYVWDAWLADERAALLVAEADGRPVGLVHLRMLSDDEAWLEGIRVDPAARRQGVGRAMTSQALVAARERGASVARLMTSAANVASQALVARFGFTRVAEVARYEAPAADVADAPAIARLGPDDFERVWDWLVQSNLRPLSGGLEIEYWAARALAEPALRAYLTAGNVWALEDWGTLQALAIAVAQNAEDGDGAGGAEPRDLEVRYADGAADGLGRLALALRGIAGEQGCGGVALWLPNLLILHDAMQGAGYSRVDDEPMWISAREL